MHYYLTTHFRAKELACKCGCNVEKMDSGFMVMLQKLRQTLDRPLFITSGYRCQEHNKAVGGASESYHLKGMAADIVCISTKDRYEIVGAAIRLGFSGLGIDKQFVHVDNRKALPKKIWTY